MDKSFHSSIADTAETLAANSCGKLANNGCRGHGRRNIARVAQQNCATSAANATTSQTSIAETLANFAVNLRYEDIPKDVVRTAIRTISIRSVAPSGL